MRKEIIATMAVLLILIGNALFSIFYAAFHEPQKSIYSVYVIQDNEITQNDTTSCVDSSLYIFDKESNRKLIVNRIQ